MKVYDSENCKIELEIKLGKGGEGTVYAINEKFCAKIYNKPLPSKEIKIQTMQRLVPAQIVAHDAPNGTIAWPYEPLYREKNKGNFCGFVMPMAGDGYQKISKVLINKERILFYRGYYNYKKMVRTAFGITDIVRVLHAFGHRVGDINENNIFVNNGGKLFFIDSDSYQIMDKERKTLYTCPVYSGNYSPPEVLKNNSSFAKKDRYYSDLFGIGMLIFRLLMVGYHPYQGIGEKYSNINSTEDKIKSGLFPYNYQTTGIKPLKSAPDFNILPSYVQNLIIKCFVHGHKDPTYRPTAHQWMDALRKYYKSLRVCSKNMNHYYYNKLYKCPWCELEEKGNPYFPDSKLINSTLTSGFKVS